MNGGVAVDIWGHSTLAGCYAVGEAAGTHGVTRPGGAALNAGQVFGIRCAKHIRAHRAARRREGEASVAPTLHGWIERIRDGLACTDGLSYRVFRDEIQARMSDKAGFICHVAAVPAALEEARALNAAIRQRGVTIEQPAQIANTMLWRQTALASEAVLAALAHYVAQGGGSRGARVLCSDAGGKVPQTRTGELEDFRFLPEREADRTRQLRVRWDGTRIEVREAGLRGIESLEGIHFEKNWAPFLTGAIYGDGYVSPVPRPVPSTSREAPE